LLPRLQLQEAVKNTQYDRLRDSRGKAPGLIGWWPARACTFVDNHDTGSTQQVGLSWGDRRLLRPCQRPHS